MAIRIPCNGVIHSDKNTDIDYSELNKYQMTQKGREIAIIALGDFYQTGEKLAELISEKTGITPTLINPRYITGIDEKMLAALEKEHSKVVTPEQIFGDIQE